MSNYEVYKKNKEKSGDNRPKFHPKDPNRYGASSLFGRGKRTFSAGYVGKKMM